MTLKYSADTNVRFIAVNSTSERLDIRIGVASSKLFLFSKEPSIYAV